MSAVTHEHFIAANRQSAVARIATGARTTTYHLEDGSSFRLDQYEMSELTRMTVGGRYSIQLCAALKRRLGDYSGR